MLPAAARQAAVLETLGIIKANSAFAHACQRVSVLQRTLKPIHRLKEKRVGSLGAIGIRHILEAVKVDHVYSDFATVSLGLGEGLIKAVGKDRSIDQTGEQVVGSLVGQLIQQISVGDRDTRQPAGQLQNFRGFG